MPAVWFSLVFRSFIHPSLVHGVYPILPPSSLFVLITSIEAHTACPQRERQRDTESKKTESRSRERPLCFHRRLLVFHFCHNGLFVYDNLAPAPRPWCLVYFKQCTVRFPRCSYVCMCFNMCMCVCVCVFPTMWEAGSRASHLSAQQGCYGNSRGPTEVMKTFWIVARWPWKSRIGLVCRWDARDATLSITYTVVVLFWKVAAVSQSTHNALRKIVSPMMGGRCSAITSKCFPQIFKIFLLRGAWFKLRSAADHQSVGINTLLLIRGWWSGAGCQVVALSGK